jgi:hypothetical protein
MTGLVYPVVVKEGVLTLAQATADEEAAFIDWKFKEKRLPPERATAEGNG